MTTCTRIPLRHHTARLVSVALLGGAALLGPALAPPATAATAASAPTCQQVWDAMPQAMQGDIKAALTLPPAQRRHALRAIRFAAAHGAYGGQVASATKKWREHRRDVFASLPADLKADITAALKLGPRKQPAAKKEIRQAALAGEYGAEVQTLAQKRQAWLQGCPGPARGWESDGAGSVA